MAIMKRKVPIIGLRELAALHTGTLMSRRDALLKCEESFELSDQLEIDTNGGLIEFKNTKEWEQAYSELKNILSAREHVPNTEEKKAMRQARTQARK